MSADDHGAADGSIVCRGHTTTAARRYQRSIVLPQFPMYPVYSESYGFRSADGVDAHTCSSGIYSEMGSRRNEPGTRGW